MSPNRIVAMLTPVLALAAGAVATWLAEHFPGVNVSQDALEEIFIAGAVTVLAPAGQWLYGWQKHEAREAEAQQTVDAIEAVALPAAGEEPELEDLDLGLEDDLDDVDDLDELDEFGDPLLDEPEPVNTGG
jgi:hypothetical protein